MEKWKEGNKENGEEEHTEQESESSAPHVRVVIRLLANHDVGGRRTTTTTTTTTTTYAQ